MGTAPKVSLTVGGVSAGCAADPSANLVGVPEDSRQAGRAAPGARYRGLYVHVPFCRHKCHYCDFYSFVDSEDRQGAFVQRLEEEARSAVEFLAGPLETVFVGGGTPTMLGAPLLARMIDSLRRILPIGPSAQWTIEANPETVDEGIAQAIVDSGVQRVSIGAQSFDPSLLRALERHHEPASVGRSIDLLRRAGMENISIDLIFAIPGSTAESWRRDLAAAISLGTQHISAYGLTYEPNTPLAVKLRQGSVKRLPEDAECEQYEHAVDALAQAGFERYEVSNWCRPGRECLHNLLYWENGDWWALGPSGSAHGSGVRWRNIPRLASWLDSHGPSPIEGFEALGPDAQAGESFMLGLRMTKGIAAQRVEQLLSLGTRSGERREAIERFCAQGLLERPPGTLRLTERGMALADTVLCALI